VTTPGPAVGVLRETAAGERRVALTPDGVTRLLKVGATVAVETGAGGSAWFPDTAYAAAGARVVDRHTLHSI
jgi:NAD(P) transhydrogenase subunit alpha